VTVSMRSEYGRWTGACVAPVALYACLSFFASCAYMGVAPEMPPDVYPTWFVALPDGPYAVGYAPAQEYEQSSTRQAVSLAARALATEELVIVNGGRGAIVGSFGTFLAGSDLEETVDSTRVAKYDDPERVLQVAHLAEMTVVLLSARDAENDDTVLDLKAMGKEPPSWTEHPPERAGYVFSVGVAADNEYETTNWNLAEEHARIRLALGRWARVQTMDKDGIISLVEADAVALRGVRIVRRWRDSRNGACFVLARATRK
jgi:hypothetical protein